MGTFEVTKEHRSEHGTLKQWGRKAWDRYTSSFDIPWLRKKPKITNPKNYNKNQLYFIIILSYKFFIQFNILPGFLHIINFKINPL